MCPPLSAGWAGRGCRSCADRCAEVMTQLVSPDQRWTQEVELVTSAGISHDTSYTQLWCHVCFISPNHLNTYQTPLISFSGSVVVRVTLKMWYTFASRNNLFTIYLVIVVGGIQFKGVNLTVQYVIFLGVWFLYLDGFRFLCFPARCGFLYCTIYNDINKVL